MRGNRTRVPPGIEPRSVKKANSYQLANIYKGAEAGIEWEESAYPFPREMDQDGIRAAFAGLFNILKTVTTAKGIQLQ
jgi:hypothetical protein